MIKLYILLEQIRDRITKYIWGYALSNVYKMVMYSAVYAVLHRGSGRYELLKPLERKIPPPLLAPAKQLANEFFDLFNYLTMLLYSYSEKPAVVEGEANLESITRWLKHEINTVNHVLMYDCISLIEFLTISAYLKLRGIKSIFLSKVFLNPIGLTRFVTQQLYGTSYRTTLLGVTQYIANNLGGAAYVKSSYVDEKVHEIGSLGIDTFVDVIAIERIAREILEKASQGKILVCADHGYDIVESVDEGYIYVTHGFRPESAFKAIPLLLLSRFAFFMGIYRVG